MMSPHRLEHPTRRAALPHWLQSCLVCSVCRAPLVATPSSWDCRACRRAYPRTDDGVFDFRDPDRSAADWHARQDWMAQEYDVLLQDGDHAARGFENDYGAIASLLSGCQGRVLDVGGGIGVTRHWLPSSDDYVLLEPSTCWEDARWGAYGERFPCLGEPAVQVRAFAEALPFASRTFDVVLHLWTLNHVMDVAASVSEAIRVIRHGGRVIAVLEEASPSWHDLLAARVPASTVSERVRLALRKLAGPLRTRPLQPDHVAVDERDLTHATGARVRFRGWVGAYLTIDLESV